MQEHAIPQDVTGYKFHIVGNMTLGQFAQLVAGAIIGFVIYQTNLFEVIKWIFILFVAGISIIAAFVPIAERPLSHWLITFLKLLFKPTRFAWRRVPKIPEPFLFKSSSDQQVVLPEVDMSPVRRQRIQEFLATTHQLVGEDQEEVQIKTYYQHVFSLFNSEKTSAPSQITIVEKPQLRVRARSIRSNPSTPLAVEVALNDEPLAAPIPTDPSATTADIERATSDFPTMPTTYASEKKVTVSFYEDVSVPENIPTTLDTTNTAGAPTATPTPTEPSPVLSTIPQPTVQSTTASPNLPTAKATFNAQLPFPTKPTTPNKLVGMVLTAQNDLVEGAIIEIRDDSGKVARAVRSNALGQFYVTTPLANGSYTLVVDKQGYAFEPVSISLQGKVVEPIEMRAHGM